MKTWTDEECDALKARVDAGGLYVESAQFENALIRAAVDEAKREVFEFLQHVEADGEIREFPEVRESLRQMIDEARRETLEEAAKVEVIMSSETRNERLRSAFPDFDGYWQGVLDTRQAIRSLGDKEPLHNCGGPAACADPDCKEYAR